jgi:hypothetical protein
MVVRLQVGSVPVQQGRRPFCVNESKIQSEIVVSAPIAAAQKSAVRLRQLRR